MPPTSFCGFRSSEVLSTVTRRSTPGIHLFIAAFIEFVVVILVRFTDIFTLVRFVFVFVFVESKVQSNPFTNIQLSLINKVWQRSALRHPVSLFSVELLHHTLRPSSLRFHNHFRKGSPLAEVLNYANPLMAHHFTIGPDVPIDVTQNGPKRSDRGEMKRPRN